MREVLAQILRDLDLIDATEAGAVLLTIRGQQELEACRGQYEKESRIPVYYQLYNPWRVPFAQRIPLTAHARPDGELALGVRVVPAGIMHRLLDAVTTAQPRLRDIAAEGNVPDTYGWRLESFIADELAGCREGVEFGSSEGPSIESLFYRRSGAIAAAMSITIEAPASTA